MLSTKVGSLINAKDLEGNTALHLTIQAGHDTIIRILLEAGACHKARNKKNKMPVELANKQQKEKISPLIIQIVRALEVKPKGVQAREANHLKNAVKIQKESSKIVQSGNKEPIFNELIQMKKFEEAKSTGLMSNLATAISANSKDIEEFLWLVAEREQDKAKAALKKIPILELLAENVTEIPENTFTDTPCKSVKTLFIAAQNGHVEAINALSKAGVPVNNQNNLGATPVYIAAENGHVEAICALKAVGANVDMPNNNGNTPIYIAACRGHAFAIIALKAAGAIILNTSLTNNFTPVHIAAFNGHADAIIALKAAGASVNVSINYGITPVWIAAYYGHAEAITALKKAGANIDKPMPDGRTSVYVAAQRGHASAIAALKAAGANVDTPEDEHSRTPLHVAAESSHTAAITALIAAGANINAPDNEGMTPIHIAAVTGHADAITILRAAGADVNKPIEDGCYTPMHFAAFNGHATAIVALKAAGANVNALDEDGLTPVYVAALRGHSLAIGALKTAGANVNTPNKRGIAPVYMAAEQGHTATIIALKVAGVDMNSRNPDGGTPAHIAAQNGHCGVINALKEAGADLNKPMFDGKTPAYIAAEQGHAAVITILKAAGANLDMARKDSRTAIFIAAQAGQQLAMAALLEAGANASVKTHFGTALEIARKGKESGHKEVLRLLVTHFKQYPNGIKPVDKMNKVDAPALPKKAKDNTTVSSVDEKGNKENLRFALEKLRTLFLNGGNLDVKSENVETYNECLKNINNNAQLVHKKSQNKYVLYVDNLALNNEAAVNAVEKMMEALEGTSVKPTDAIWPAVNVSYQYEDNDIQAILSARLKQLQVQNPKLLIKPIKELGAVDDMTGFELKNRLVAEAKNKAGARICLIPCNLGNAHWVGMLLEFNKEAEVLRAQYIDSFTTHATVPETFQAQLQSVYPKARFQTLALLQQPDNDSCGAYTIENLLMAALGIQSPADRESIRRMHLECLREYNPTFYRAFDERQRNNRPTTATIHEQLGYLDGLQNIWFSKPELNRILALKQCLSKLPPKIQTAILEAFKHKTAYNDNHALHLNTIRRALQKAVQLEPKALIEIMELLFEAWNSSSSLSLDKIKFRVSYNEILAVSERYLEPAKINALQKNLAEQIKQDEEFARELQLELWHSGETSEMNQENFKAQLSDVKTQIDSLEPGIPKEPAPGGPHELMFSHQVPLLPTRNNAAEVAASAENSHDKDIEEFLTCIAEGKQVKAKAILQKHPNLVSLAGEITELSKPAFIDTPWKSANTLFMAADRGHIGAINALSKAGVSVNTRNNIGATALYIAAKKGQTAVITELITEGANVNTPRDDGATPILVAAQNGHAEAIAVLKTAGANVNTPRNDSATPMLIAAHNGHLEAVAALLEAGADANIKTKWDTALDIAKKGKKPEHLKIVSLLQAHIKQYSDGIKRVMEKQSSDEVRFSDIKTRLEPLVLPTIAAAVPEANPKDVEEFLTCIAEGEQAKAKAILKRNPDLEKQTRARAKAEAIRLKRDSALISLMGEVIDLPKHTFMETPWKSLKTLFLAVERGHIGAINALIKVAVPINKPNSVGVTPVFIAAENGHAEAIGILKAAGADVNAPDKYGRVAINAAAVNGHVGAITALKAAGANVNRSWQGYTPTFGAAENGRIEAIAALKAAGADMDTPSNDGGTPVWIAAQNGYAEAVTALKTAGANVDTPDNEGFTPIYMAAQNGHTQVIRALIKAGAKVNTPIPNGETPVFIAAQNGHAEAIAVLKSAGANVNTPRKDGYTPVYIAAQHGHAEAITALKAAGAAMDTLDREGFTPVHIAAQKGQVEAIYALKAAGATMDKRCNGATPVHMAAQSGRAEAITALKATGAAMDALCNGATPIYFAAQSGHASAITALKNAGADVDRASKGITPVWIAAQNGHLGAITALKAAGANVNTPDNEGCTPLFIAAKKGQPAAITALLFAGADVNIPNNDGVTPISVATMLGHNLIIADLKAAGATMSLPAKLVTRMEDIARKAFGARITLSDQERNVSMLFSSKGSPISKTEGDGSKYFMGTQIEVLADNIGVESKNPDAPRFSTESSASAVHPNSTTAAHINPKDIQKFLTLVVEGEQDKAEAMLRANSMLASVSGDVTDLSQRTFVSITGFQYAVWALDWHMWTMIQKYLPDEEAKKQAQGFETGAWVKSHGVHAQRLLESLIKAYQTTVDLYHAGKHDEGDKVWVQQVGRAQRLLPAHVVNEYCHPTRRFFPVPNFKDTSAFPRSRIYDEGEWFTSLYKGGKLGDKFAVCRGGDAMTMAESRVMAFGMDSVLDIDKTCLRALVSTRKAQREELVDELCVRKVKKFVA